MPSPSLLLWDIGGVLLSDGFDRRSRAEAVRKFGLDGPEFERRHAAVEIDFESGRIDRTGYLDATVFYEPRPFSPEEFWAFVLAQSRPYPDAIATARALRSSGRYRMAVLSNESRELNEYRIRTFGLAPLFDAFFSSCYTGLRKPDPAAFRQALEITQQAPDSSLFLDDRAENVEAAARLGLRTLRVEEPGRLREELTRVGVSAT